MAWTHPRRGSSRKFHEYADQAADETSNDLSQVCASFDNGGGVAVGDAFAVYSIVASPPNWNNTVTQSGVYKELLEAASAVSRVIPVFIAQEDVSIPDIVSLPCPTGSAFNSAHDIKLENNLPWFLLNASRFSNYRIIGRRSTLEAILMVLQRPWCVLELCCCQNPAISAIHQFANIATKLSPRLYQPALKLLSQEMKKRELDTYNPPSDRHPHLFGPHIPFTDNNITWLEVQTLYSEMSHSRIRSHNSFWLGLISSCAVYLGISCSDLIRNLVGISSTCTYFRENQRIPKKHYYGNSSNNIFDSTYPTTIRNTKAVLRRSGSSPDISYQADQLQPFNWKTLNNNRQYLLCLYINILQAITNSSV
jgi:hypothetical protein